MSYRPFVLVIFILIYSSISSIPFFVVYTQVEAIKPYFFRNSLSALKLRISSKSAALGRWRYWLISYFRMAGAGAGPTGDWTLSQVQ